jgi:hypothetical protein
MRQARRPRRSTICALMMVPTMPTVLSPPARPFCVRSLYPAAERRTGK